MAAFLTKNAPGLRTSPVKRGNWVVKNVLGEHIPPPPPTVPQAAAGRGQAGSAAAPDAGAAPRGSAVRRAATPSSTRWDWCSKASVRSASAATSDLAGRAGRRVGRRSRAAAGRRRRRACATTSARHRQRDFVDNLSGKLLAYALGRSLALTDEPLIEEMSRKLAARGYRFDSLIESIVTSRQFLNKRGSSRLANESQRHESARQPRRRSA